MGGGGRWVTDEWVSGGRTDVMPCLAELGVQLQCRQAPAEQRAFTSRPSGGQLQHHDHPAHMIHLSPPLTCQFIGEDAGWRVHYFVFYFMLDGP